MSIEWLASIALNAVSCTKESFPSSTDLFTHFFVHSKRGKQASNSDESVTKDYRDILVHDCWASYFGLDVDDHG